MISSDYIFSQWLRLWWRTKYLECEVTGAYGILLNCCLNCIIQTMSAYVTVAEFRYCTSSHGSYMSSLKPTSNCPVQTTTCFDAHDQWKHYTFVRLEVFSASCIPVNTLFKNFSCWYIKPVHRYHNERRNWIILYFLSHAWPTIITDIFLKESLWKSQDFHLNNTMYRYTWLDFHLNNTVHDMHEWYYNRKPSLIYAFNSQVFISGFTCAASL